MKRTIISMLISLLKTVFTLKKICLIASIFCAIYCVKARLFKNKSNIKKSPPTTAITPIKQSSFPKESKIELVLTLSQTYRLPKDLIKNLLLFNEIPMTQKNLLFLSFYQPGFIGNGNGEINESNPPQFPYKQEIFLDNYLVANFVPANPFVKESSDRIFITDTRVNEHIVIGDQEDIYVEQIFKKLITMIPFFQYRTLKECELINEMFFCTKQCNTIDTIKTLSERLIEIESEDLRFALFEQLKIKAYHFWHSFEWDNEKKIPAGISKTDKILVHPHFFLWHINNKPGDDKLMSTDEFYSLFTSQRRYSTLKDDGSLLGEQAYEFSVYSDQERYYFKYPHYFITIVKSMGPFFSAGNPTIIKKNNDGDICDY